MATTSLPRTEVRRIGQLSPTLAADPILPGIIIGPAYHLRDYPLDRAQVGIGVYGTPLAPCDGINNGAPLAGADAVTVTSPPDNAPGAVLDRDSVEVWAEDVIVQLATGTAATRTLSSPDQNLIATGVDLAAAGVVPGDYLVLSFNALVPPFVARRRITEVAGVGTSTLSTGEVRVSVDLSDPELGVSTGPYPWRVERNIGTARIPAAYVEVSGLRTIVKGGVLLSVDVDGDGDGDLETVLVHSCNCFMQYRSLRQDLNRYQTITSSSDIETVVGRIDERNPLAAALLVAFRHTDRAIAIFGITRDNLNGLLNRDAAYLEALNALQTRTDIYGVTPLTAGLSTIQSLQTRIDQFALPEIAAYRRLFAAHGPYPSTREVIPNRAGVAEIVAGDLFRVFASADAGFASAGVSEDDVLYIPRNTTETSYPIRLAYDDDRVLLKDGPGVLTQSFDRFYVLRGEGRAVGLTGTLEIVWTGGQNRAKPANKTVNTDYVGKVLRLTRNGGVDTVEPAAAALTIQDLTYTAQALGEDGNLITVEYVDPGSPSEPLAVSVVGVNITVTLGTDIGSNVISTSTDVKNAIEASAPADALVAVTVTGGGFNVQQASAVDFLEGGRNNGRYLILSVDEGSTADLTVQDLTYTSRASSTDGNLIEVEYVDPAANSQPLTVSVAGTVITVSLATDGAGSVAIAANSADNILAAIEAHPVANGLVVVEVSGTGTDQQVPAAAAALTGGLDPYYVVYGGLQFPTSFSSQYGATVRDTLVARTLPVSYTIRRQYRGLYAASGGFLTGSIDVSVGDLVQIPLPPSSSNDDYDGELASATVAQVLSDSRVILDVYEDLVSDDPEDASATQTIHHFRILTQLTLDGLKDYLVDVVQSFGSAWFSHIGPDGVEVEGLQNASTGTQSMQPGYYLAVAVMALCTALPVQQPLTRRALNGFGRLQNSNFFFTPDQIAELSNNGYFMFVQDQPDSPPYVLHQITTDLTAVEFAELSMMRCYDYAARRLKAALDRVLGRVNIADDTLEFIQESLDSEIAFMASNKEPLIGAPILGGQTLSVIRNPARADGVQVTVSLDFPSPLNNIQLFIDG